MDGRPLEGRKGTVTVRSGTQVKVSGPAGSTTDVCSGFPDAITEADTESTASAPKPVSVKDESVTSIAE